MRFRPILAALLFLAAPGAPIRADDKPAKAVMIYYTGRVQGVGFRATAAEIARDYPVTGWVKNLDDGRVQLLVEGPEASVDAFLKAVHKRWEKNIDKEEVEKQKVSGKLKGFEVVK
jgi:acylphosphatase